MSISEIRKKIVRRVNEVENDIILEEVFRILDHSDNVTEIYQFSQTQLNILDKREHEVKNGKFINNEDSELELDKWLK